jgi:DNA-binding transcriptional ArsR family regulator
MSFRTTDEISVSDPKVLRALAHPVRTALLSRLHVGPATATECSEAVAESPSSCSYHLRVLARLGFVEEVPSDDGRERRWKVVVTGYSYEPDDTPEGRAAYDALVTEHLRIAHQRFSEYMAAEPSLDQGWRDAATMSTGAFWATADELSELMLEIRELIEPFFNRVEPEVRPPGSRRIAWHMYAVPWSRDH